MIQLYTVALVALFGAISPGPDFIVVSKNALTYNRRCAIMAALGVGTGILVHSAYCVLGFAFVIIHSALLFNIIKYFGATYLIYLGVKSLLTKESHLPIAIKNKKHRSLWSSFRDGLLTNVLNPKCTLFMISVFTLAVKPHPLLIQAGYGLEIALITAAWFMFLAYGLTIHPVKSRIEAIQYAVTKLIGGILVAVAVAIIFKAH